ncbi:flagellar hook protein [Bacillus timonensis]|uniref:Flagellar hook-associated protein 2 n=1 Tax=Bacillus timonensis TaxID=1033734 RepID=A0A4V6RSV7_9BACI|nr:flagellar filament capping protein FliD [Bacillus timonensis]THE12353.1 flagellar hook protein [Bacillus timonensis]
MNMRIGGLASGMDIDQLVKDLMKAERIPLNKMNQQKQTLEWQRDDYRSMNSLLLSLRDLSFNMKLSSTFRAKNTTSSNESKVTATASAAAGNVSYTLSKVDKLATAATKVNAGDIRKNKDFDASASIWSQKDNFNDTATDYGDGFNWKIGALAKDTKTITDPTETIKLSKINFKTDDDSIENMQVKVNGTFYTVYTDDVPINDPNVKNKVHLASDGTLTFSNSLEKGSKVTVDYFIDNYSQEIKVPKPSDTATNPNTTFQLSKASLSTDGMSIFVGGTEYTKVYSTSDWDNLDDTQKASSVLVDLESGKLTFSKKLEEGDVIKADFKQNYFSFGLETFNEKGESVKEKFSVEGSSSFSSIINRISSSAAGVNAFYDDFTGQVTLTRSQTGDFNKNGEEIKITGDFLNNVLQFSTSIETGGNNAEFTINGLETQRYFNNFTINGVNFTLKDTFDSTDPAKNDAPVTVGVTTNSETVLDNIVNFVEKYNETIQKINEKLNEERYRSYQPLSSEEREALSDKEAELWEEKAKSGLIRRDSILSSGLNQFRMDLYTPVTNLSMDTAFNQLASIGIKTTANYMDRGKLEIDKAKLKEAIEKDPEAVEKLFTADGSTYAEKGLINRLYDSLTATMDKVSERAGKSTWTTQKYTIGKNLDSLKDSIDRFENRLIQIEDRYWRQFTAMEKAIQRANQQSAYLMQNFFSG